MNLVKEDILCSTSSWHLSHILKAGHPVSCPTLCVLCVVCCMFGRNVWIVRLGVWVSFFSFYCFLASVLYTFLHITGCRSQSVEWWVCSGGKKGLMSSCQ